MTTPIATFSGISSGINYADLVDQIIRAESAPAARARATATKYQNQLNALATYRGLLTDLSTTARKLQDGSALLAPSVSVTDPPGGRTVVSASPTVDSAPGTYSVEVLRLAQREKIVGPQALDTTTALGVSGSFTVNGRAVTVKATDTLADVRDAINAANGGATPSAVTASVLSLGASAGRLSLTADKTGAAGIDLVDGPEGVLAQLGFVSAATVTSAALTDGSGTAPATAGTALAALGSGGALAGVKPGDTLTIAGTRGDGSAVSLTFTVGAASTMQDLLDRINDATDGFGAGARPAAAALDGQGRIRLTDGTGGTSALSLSITANNEGGGRLALGPFTAGTRATPTTAGADAAFKVDGVALTRASNTVTDALPGVTLTLLASQPGSTSEITVARSASAARGAVQGFVDAYNKVVSFIQQQGTGDAKSGSFPALYGDSAIRVPRAALSSTLLQSITGAPADLATMRSIGLSLGKDGKLTLDATTFDAAYNTRFNDVRGLFMEKGSTTNPALKFVTSAGKAAGGTYAVAITQAATRAAVLSSGFPGVYTGAGAADLLTVADSSTGGAARIALTEGMTTAQIVDALNAAFAAPSAQRLATAASFSTDAAGTTPATAATTFAELFQAGASAGVAAGDTITYTGTRAGGASFTGTFTVADPATSTLGDLAAQLQTAYGSDATVSVQDGRIVVEAAATGASSIGLSLSAQKQGGGTLAFGSTTISKGYSSLDLSAEAVGNEVRIVHGAYGSARGITVSLQGAAAAQVGLAAGTSYGLDVAGTIGGQTATGAGQQLVVDAGQGAAGLTVSYTGSVPAASAGDVSLTVGVGALMQRLAASWLDTASGLVGSKDTLLNQRITDLNDRADRIDARLALRRAALLKQFNAMDVAIAQLQNQTKSLAALTSPQNGN